MLWALTWVLASPGTLSSSENIHFYVARCALVLGIVETLHCSPQPSSIPLGGKVNLSFPRICQFLLILLLSMAVAFPQNLFAQDHVVSSSELRKDLQEVAAAREKNLAQLDHLFLSGQGRKALETAHVNYQQVDKAVRSLSDDDLMRLSTRAQNAQSDFAAGRITSTDLLWIIVAVLVIILVIVAVRY